MPCCKCCCGNKICENGDEGKCCCQGDNNSIECCNEGEYCCGGACQATPCGCCCINKQPDPTKTSQADCENAGGIWKPDVTCAAANCFCEPCNECSFPADSLEFVDAAPAPCGQFPLNISSKRGQSFGTAIPPGVSWKPGYPAALEGCDWRWMTDYSFKECFGTECQQAQSGTCCSIQKYRFKLLVIDCDDQSFVDVTDQAASFGNPGAPYQEIGPFEVVWDQCQASNCVNLECTEYPEYLAQPEPVCAP